jgi:hypothetical protein
LEKSVWSQVVAYQLGGAASTTLAFYSSCRHVSSKPRAKLT